DVSVYGHNRSTGDTFVAITAANGTYNLMGLPPSSMGYTVCFNPRYISAGTTGFLPRCYKNTAWDGVSAYPGSATKVSVSLGHTHSGVSGHVPVGGAISGTVKNSANGTALADAEVIVYASSGLSALGFDNTDAQGRYTVKGLRAATGDRVCVYPS